MLRGTGWELSLNLPTIRRIRFGVEFLRGYIVIDFLILYGLWRAVSYSNV